MGQVKLPELGGSRGKKMANSDKDPVSRDTEDGQPNGPVPPKQDNSGEANPEGEWASQAMSFPREAMFVAVICLAQFCNQAANSVTIYLINKIGADLGVADDQGRLGWLVAGFSLTAGTFLLLSGRLGDAFGYKRMLVLGFAWFGLWSVVAGVALYSGYTLFVFARVFQGIGAAVCIPNALAALGAAYPPGNRKSMVFALFGASAPVGALTAAIVASSLSLLWWPWAFFALALTLFILAVATCFVVPAAAPTTRKRPAGPPRNLVAELDLVGGTTGITALVLFNFAWNQAPIAGWASAQVLVTLVLGLALFVAFLWIEKKHSAHPLLPLDALSADILFVLGAIACGWSMFGIWVLYSVLVFENVRQLSPLLTALWTSPIIVTGLIAAVTTGWLLGPGKYTPATVMTIAMAAFTTGMVLFTTAPVDQLYWGQTFVSILVIPFGMDMSFPAATMILSDAVRKEHQGIAASLVTTVVNYSISLGVGLAGTVDVHTTNPGGGAAGATRADLYRGYKNALWLAVGLAAAGLVVSLVFLGKEHWRRRRGRGRVVPGNVNAPAGDEEGAMPRKE